MPIERLTREQLTDTKAEEALEKLSPTDDAALVMLRNIQAQLDDHEQRITALEP